MRFENVWFRYDGRFVLKGISLDVDKTFVCGYNGSGKSTLLKISSGLLKPNEGRVFGRSVYVHQNVDDYILFNTVFGELTFSNALKFARRFGLRLDKRTSELSDGEKRLLTIALAMSKGRCLALDEPFANLHPSIAKKILKYLDHFIIAENRLSLCKDFVWIEDGRICEPPDFSDLSCFEPLYDVGEVVLSVENLTFGYEKALFKNLSFEVRRGEIVAIVGMNGCGKTTLLKILVGFLKPWEGEVSVKGRIGICFSNPYYHVQEPVSFGQAKMKAILKAFKGDIVVLDEPTAGLDVRRKFEILKIAKEMKKSVVMATHDEEILEFCDHVIEI